MYTSHRPACFPCFLCFSFLIQPGGSVLSLNLSTLGRWAGRRPILTWPAVLWPPDPEGRPAEEGPHAMPMAETSPLQGEGAKFEFRCGRVMECIELSDESMGLP